MRDKKLEQSIKGIAIILLFGSFIFHTPSSISKQVDKIKTLPYDTNCVTRQEKDSCHSIKFEESMYCRFMFEKTDSLLNCFNTQHD